MSMFKTLSDLRKNTIENKGSGGPQDGERVQRYFTVKSGESFLIRFRQELTEDSQNYSEDTGVAHVVSVHTNPLDFRKSAVCTGDHEEFGYRCFGCEQVVRDRGWKAKQHLLVNVAVYNAEDDVWEPRVLDQKFTGAHVAETVVTFATEYGTILDRDFKISRTGQKQQTKYNLIPLAPKDANESIASLPMHDLTRVYRIMNPAEQAGFYIAEDDSSSSNDWK